MRDGYLRGALLRTATPRQLDVLVAYVASGGSVPDAAELAGIRPSTVKRHLADLRARSGLTTEQLIYAGRAAGWLVVPSLEPSLSDSRSAPAQPVTDREVELFTWAPRAPERPSFGPSRRTSNWSGQEDSNPPVRPEPPWVSRRLARR
jgi:DNA-binding CsgD family transcriptional regulator